MKTSSNHVADEAVGPVRVWESLSMARTSTNAAERAAVAAFTTSTAASGVL